MPDNVLPRPPSLRDIALSNPAARSLQAIANRALIVDDQLPDITAPSPAFRSLRDLGWPEEDNPDLIPIGSANQPPVPTLIFGKKADESRPKPQPPEPTKINELPNVRTPYASDKDAERAKKLAKMWIAHPKSIAKAEEIPVDPTKFTSIGAYGAWLRCIKALEESNAAPPKGVKYYADKLGVPCELLIKKAVSTRSSWTTGDHLTASNIDATLTNGTELIGEDHLTHLLRERATGSCPATGHSFNVSEGVLSPVAGVDYGHNDSAEEGRHAIKLYSPRTMSHHSKLAVCEHPSCEIKVMRNTYTRDPRSAERGYYCRHHHAMRSSGHTFSSYHSTSGSIKFKHGGNEKDLDYIGLEIEFLGNRMHAINEVTDVDPDCESFRLENDATCDGEIISNPHNITEYRKSFSHKLYTLGRKLRKAGLRAWTMPDGRDTECGLHFHMNRGALRPLHIFRLFKLMYQNNDHWFELSGRRHKEYRYCNFNVPDDEASRRRVLRSLGKFRAPNDASFRADRGRPLNFNNEHGTIECRIMRGSFATGHLNATSELGYCLMQFVRDPRVPLNHMSFGHFARYAIHRVREFPHLVDLIARRGLNMVEPEVEKPTDKPYIPEPVYWTNEMGQQIKFNHDILEQMYEQEPNVTFAVQYRELPLDIEPYQRPCDTFTVSRIVQRFDNGVAAIRSYSEDGQPSLRAKMQSLLPLYTRVLNEYTSSSVYWIVTHEWNGLKRGTILVGDYNHNECIPLTNLPIIRARVAGSSENLTKFMVPMHMLAPIDSRCIIDIRRNTIEPKQLRFEKQTLFKALYKIRRTVECLRKIPGYVARRS